jgi:hypothetical protein
VGSVAVYVYYLKEKSEELETIQKSGLCPRCKERSIFLSDQRGVGCGSKVVTFVCTNCDYENSFSIEGGCGI